MSRALRWLLLALALAPAGAGAAEVYSDFEVGAAFGGYNDVRIPGEGGTLFSLTDDLRTSPAPVFRVRVGVVLGERHDLSALYATLRLNARGSVDRDVFFNGVEFPAGEPLRAEYRFDSWRLTYRYGLVVSESFRLDVGVTAKIRDAAFGVDGAQFTQKTNTGFVPLVHLRLSWFVAGPFGLLLEADALAVPQGRAEDVLAALQLRLAENVVLRLGYRLLEGGADNDEVYTFALVHYAVGGLRVAF